MTTRERVSMISDIINLMSVTFRKLADTADIAAVLAGELLDVREQWEEEVKPFSCQAETP